MNTHLERLRRRLAPYELHLALMLLLMMAMFSVANWATLPRYAGLDLCKFWEIAKSQRASGFTLGSPYRNPDAYQVEIRELERVANDRTFTDASHLRKGLDLPGTPLLFAAFDVLPSQYRLSVWLFRALQLACFAVSVLVLCRFVTRRLWPFGLAFGALLTIDYDPLSFDLEVGNVDCLQLLALVGCAQLALQLRKDDSLIEALRASLIAALATLLAMLKPNIGMALLMLALCVLVRSDFLSRVAAALVALASLALFAAMAALFFRAWSVWPDWWNATFHSVGRLSYPIESTGNRSTSLYLSQLWGMPTSSVMLLTAATLLSSFVIAGIARPAAPDRPWHCRAAYGLTRLKDPYFCISLGLIVTFAISPLVWPHYFILD